MKIKMTKLIKIHDLHQSKNQYSTRTKLVFHPSLMRNRNNKLIKSLKKI